MWVTEGVFCFFGTQELGYSLNGCDTVKVPERGSLPPWSCDQDTWGCALDGNWEEARQMVWEELVLCGSQGPGLGRTPAQAQLRLSLIPGFPSRRAAQADREPAPCLHRCAGRWS